MSRPGLLSFVLTSLLISASAQAQPLLPTQEIGTQGAVIATNEWNRVKLTEGAGKDQFLHINKDHYLFVFELKALIDRRSDFERKVQETLDRFGARMSDAQIEPEMVYERLDAFTRATRRFTATVNSIELGYQLDLVSAGDGFGYLFVSWTARTKFEGHGALIDSLLESFRLPGEDTEHFRRSQVTPHSFDFGAYKVGISFQDSIFAEGDSKPGERYTFTGDEDEMALHIFVDAFDGGVDKALEAIRAITVGEDPAEDLLRGDIETPAGKGRQLLLRKKEGDAEIEVAIAMIEIDPEFFIDVRMVTNAAIGHREELWQRLLATLEVEREAKVEAFPIGKTSAAPKTYPGEAARLLMEGARYRAPLAWTEPTSLPNGDLFVWSEGALLRFAAASAAAEPEVIVEMEDKAGVRAFSWGGQIYLDSSTRELRKVVDGRPEPAGIEVDKVAAWGDELLYFRRGEKAKVFGMLGLPNLGGSRVFLRRPGGEERQVLELPELDVVALAVHEGQALVAAAPPEVNQWNATEAKTELRLVALETGRSRQLEPWIWVRSISASSRGWLISGTPETGVDGVYLHSGQGGRELLISGDSTGLHLDEQNLTFAVENCPEPGVYRCVYEAPLALVRLQGPGFWPWGEKEFAKIATAAAARVVDGQILLPMPESREALTAFLAAANEESIEITGWPLPTSAAAIDAFFNDMASSEELGPYGGALISALLTEGLLDAGAEWVPPLGSGPFGLNKQIPQDHTLAIRVHPPAIVRFSVGEEGLHSPVSQMLEAARGRTILVGPDPLALDQRLRESNLGTLPDLLRQGTDKALAALLAEHPKNFELRDHVFQHLAARQRFDVLAKVAAPWAARADAKVGDVLAWAAARPVGKLKAAEVEELIVRLKAAIVSFPLEAGFYLQLGAAYEKTEMTDKNLYARACYQKALELLKWGENVDAAKAALARLEKVQP